MESGGDTLDVMVMKGESQLYTKAFFKSTHHNSYISVQSGHHPQWLHNISKGQFTHIRWNCTLDADYVTQAQYIKQWFVEKGYRARRLDKLIAEVGSNSQETCLIPKERPQDSKHEWGFISGFHEQYREIESIFKKHWNILSMDKVLSKILPENPPFIYRRTTLFGDQVVKKVLDPQTKQKCFGIEQASMPA